MKDIQFDANTREVVFTADGDFAVTDNPSVQNGAILLQGRCFNAVQPAFGIGYNHQVQGGPVSQAAYQLSRWVSQVTADGGQAKWSRLPAVNQNFDFSAVVNYPGPSTGSGATGPSQVNGTATPGTAYTVPANSSIGDAVLNSTGEMGDNSVGAVNNWDLLLTENNFDSWTPALTAGLVLAPPMTVNANLNNYRALNQYPANNFSVPGIYAQLVGVFDQMNG